jgi:hypothetical protein
MKKSIQVVIGGYIYTVIERWIADYPSEVCVCVHFTLSPSITNSHSILALTHTHTHAHFSLLRCRWAGSA